jgi:hypothetical protein
MDSREVEVGLDLGGPSSPDSNTSKRDGMDIVREHEQKCHQKKKNEREKKESKRKGNGSMQGRVNRQKLTRPMKGKNNKKIF